MQERDSLEELSREELIQHVRALRKELARQQATNKAVSKTAGKSVLRFFFGSRLYKSTNKGFAEWVNWIESGAQRDQWPKQETGNFVAALTARLLRIGFIAVLGAVVTSVVLVTQTIILNTQTKQLEAQNQHFEQQNSFIAFEQTSKFRELLVSTANASRSRPSQSTIDQLVELGTKETETVHKALEPLLTDESTAVSVGAIQVLGKLNVQVDGFNANIPGANLVEANLSGANLRAADVERADLRLSNFSGADLSTADLQGANLTNANFSNVDFSSADLRSTTVQGTDFRGANFSNAYLPSDEVLCSAYDLTNVQPDAVLTRVVQACPDKINP